MPSFSKYYAIDGKISTYSPQTTIDPTSPQHHGEYFARIVNIMKNIVRLKGRSWENSC